MATARDLSGIELSFNNLAGWNYAGQNLTRANFTGTTITGADFTGADIRGAYVSNADLHGVDATNLIRADGKIECLTLNPGQQLDIRDYFGNPTAPFPLPPVPIMVQQHLTVSEGATLRLVIEADDWDSTISFASGIPVTLGGTLDLTFADDVSFSSQIGRTFDVFDWTGVSPTGTFNVASPYVWDQSMLYTTGKVMFLAANGLAGDFNGDNMVDAGDYVVWRKGLGTSYTQAAFNLWRANFGATLGAGDGSHSTTVPELASAYIFLLGITGVLATGRFRGSKLIGM